MKKMITLMLGIFLLTGISATVYVVPGGTGDGKSWATAMGSIQSAVNAAQVLFSSTATPQDVWVKAGTYSTSTAPVLMKEGVNLYGGFAGAETEVSQRAKGTNPWDFTNPTILDGGGLNKSFFFFDNRIVALGSTIRSALPESEVHTTLFQVDAANENLIPQLNNKKIRQLPFHKSIQQKSSELSDGLGNYFFVNDALINFRRSVQHSFHEETDEPTRHPFTLACINHGKKASITDGYEYLIAIQPASNQLNQLRRDVWQGKVYRLLSRDSVLHAVHDYATNTTAFVFFEAGKTTNLVRDVSQPCMVMTRMGTDNSLLLSVADPDLRFYEGPADEQTDAAGKRIERSIYSRPWINNASAEGIVILEIEGNWNVPNSDFFSLIEKKKDSTRISVKTQHGLTREIRLSR